MTMRVVAKFYPYSSEAQAEQAKDALEAFKQEVLAPRCGTSVSLDVIETEETVEGTTTPQKVIKIDGHIHFNK